MNRVTSIMLPAFLTLVLVYVIAAGGQQVPPRPGVPYQCSACAPNKCITDGSTFGCYKGPVTPSPCAVHGDWVPTERVFSAERHAVAPAIRLQRTSRNLQASRLVADRVEQQSTPGFLLQAQQTTQPSDGGYIQTGRYEVNHQTWTNRGAVLSVYGLGTINPCEPGAYQLGYPGKKVLTIYYVGPMTGAQGQTAYKYRFWNTEKVAVKVPAANPQGYVTQIVTKQAIRYVTFQKTTLQVVGSRVPLYYYAVVWIGLGDKGQDLDEWWSLVQ